MTANPQTESLAAALSVAVRVEPELIRAVRLEVLPTLDVGCEADLWFSPMVAVREPQSIVLKHEVRQNLHRKLGTMLMAAHDHDPIKQLWQVISRVHAGISPALLLEEHITWLAISRGSDATDRINAELQTALEAVVVQKRNGVAEWFAGAWSRLPDAALNTKGAWKLRQASGAVRTLAKPLAAQPSSALRLADIADLVDFLPDVKLYVHRDHRTLRVGALAPRPGTYAIQLPDTEPRILEVEEMSESSAVSTTPLSLPRDQTASLPVGSGSVRLRTGRGMVYEIPMADTQSRSRIFLSYTRNDLGYARALKQWLLDREATSHIDDVYLDTDSLRAGERWSDALQSAVRHCELVICLLSKDYAQSSFAASEYRSAMGLGKRIVIASINRFVTSPFADHHQTVDLVGDEPTTKIYVSDEPVALSESGLLAILRIVRESTVGAWSWQWPPEDDPERLPYRGFHRYDENDAGVFFGRDEDVLGCMDYLRYFSANRDDPLLQIVGRDGVGKSSFLRAGVLAHMRRTPGEFAPLDVVSARDPHAAYDGLARAIFSARANLGLSWPSSTEIRLACTNDVNRVRDYLTEYQNTLRKSAPPGYSPTASAPVVVLAIDDAEGLLMDEPSSESQRFAQTLLDLTAPRRNDSRDGLTVALLIATETSDRSQHSPLSKLGRTLVHLETVTTNSLRELITGPAERTSEAGHPLEIDPTLVETLARAAIKREDAVALLSLTMRQLVELRGDSGRLTVDDFRALGGFEGAVTQHVHSLLDSNRRDEEFAAARDVCIPWLVTVETENGAAVPRETRLGDLPSSRRDLLERFVDHRILSTFRVAGETTVKIALPALLELWRDLASWVRDDMDRLTLAARIEDNASEWADSNHDPAWLLTGAALSEADTLMGDHRYAARLSSVSSYLAASRGVLRSGISSAPDWTDLVPPPADLPADKKWHVFISYRSVERGWVVALYDILKGLGYQVFLDQYALTAAEPLAFSLGEALDASQSAIVVWSNRFEDSEWSKQVARDLTTRRSDGEDFKFVIAQLDDTPLPGLFNQRLWVNFSDQPEGPSATNMLRLLFGLRDEPLPPIGVKMAADVDDEMRDGLLSIKAWRDIGDSDGLVELAETDNMAWTSSPMLMCKAAEALIALSRLSEALTVLERAEAHFPKALRPKQLRGLALARSGKTKEAQFVMAKLHADGQIGPETLGIYARTWMDRYNAEGEIAYLLKSRDLYLQAFEALPTDYYIGINAASTSLLAGEPERAAELAERVLQIVGDRPVPDDYWRTATIADALLLTGKVEEAATMYHAAVLVAPGESGSHHATRATASLLLSALDLTDEQRAQVTSAFPDY